MHGARHDDRPTLTVLRLAGLKPDGACHQVNLRDFQPEDLATSPAVGAGKLEDGPEPQADFAVLACQLVVSPWDTSKREQKTTSSPTKPRWD